MRNAPFSLITPAVGGGVRPTDSASIRLRHSTRDPMVSAAGLARTAAHGSARRANRWAAALRSDLNTALAVALMLLILTTLGVASLVVTSARADERIPTAPVARVATGVATAPLGSLTDQAARVTAPTTTTPKPVPATASGPDWTRPPLTTAQLSRLGRKVAPGLVDIVTSLPDGTGKAGTGIVLSSSGEVLTNDHVISHAASITATDLGNGRSYPVTVLGASPAHDIAVLCLDGASGLQTARLGHSATLRTGEQVASLGNAYGLSQTQINAGPITALDQTIASTTDSGQPLRGLIRADNRIVPGESGGPLVDSHGRIVGVSVAAEFTASEHIPTGTGYAIPIDNAVHTAHALLSHPHHSTDRPADTRRPGPSAAPSCPHTSHHGIGCSTHLAPACSPR
jgi:S1-C subfamily serine protease